MPSRKFLRFLSAGFSMTEVMVGGAILAGVALGGAQMFKEQRKAQTKVDQEAEILSYHQRLTKFMQDDKNCTATMRAAGAFGKSVTTMNTVNIQNLYSCPSCTTLGFNYDVSNTVPVDTGMGVDRWTDPLAYMWRVTAIQWKTPPNASGNAVLRVTYGTDPAWTSSRARKVQSISKDINVTLRFTQNNDPNLRMFSECISAQESSVNNLQNDICGSMSQITSTGNIMVWSDASQGCVSIGPATTGTIVKNCGAPNMVIEGVRADGTVSCKSLTDGVTNPAGDFMNNAGCNPGASIRMDYDPVTQRLKATCY